MLVIPQVVIISSDTWTNFHDFSEGVICPYECSEAADLKFLKLPHASNLCRELSIKAFLNSFGYLDGDLGSDDQTGDAYYDSESNEEDIDLYN